MQRNDGDYVKTLIKKKKKSVSKPTGTQHTFKKKSQPHSDTHPCDLHTSSHTNQITTSLHYASTHPPQPIPSRVESP